MRVLHVGNTANNAYLNAKLQRRVGVEADALCDAWHTISQPEWEDAELEGHYDDFAPLGEAAARNGWRRPEWVLQPAGWDPEFKNQPWLRERLSLLATAPLLVADYRRLRRQYGPLEEVLGSRLSLADVVRASAWQRRLDRSVERLSRLFGRYEVVQAYGEHPILPLIVSPGRPFVAFEHGTMREIPFEDSYRGRLLSLAYRRAAKVIISNPDVLPSARRLGLENYVFIPHPVDETKYTPGTSQLRAELEAEGADPVLLCPSRHDWHVKGTDRMLEGFGELVRTERPNALLLLAEWGEEVERSRALVRELGLERNVRWCPPFPKLRLIDAYRAADIVLDQFLLGTFGAIAPEAMACGRPVVLSFDPALHEWCFPETPPVVSASTPAEIYQRLRGLATDAAERQRLGEAGRAWVERHHGWRLVVDRHRAVYEEVLGLRASP